MVLRRIELRSETYKVSALTNRRQNQYETIIRHQPQIVNYQNLNFPGSVGGLSPTDSLIIPPSEPPVNPSVTVRAVSGQVDSHTEHIRIGGANALHSGV
jgi:hypothetical protein